jgi:hypothetical protein
LAGLFSPLPPPFFLRPARPDAPFPPCPARSNRSNRGGSLAGKTKVSRKVALWACRSLLFQTSIYYPIPLFSTHSRYISICISSYLYILSNTSLFYSTLHISLYFYIFICFYTYIFIFSYGFLTIFSTVYLRLTLYSCLPTVGSTVPSTSFSIRLPHYGFLLFYSLHIPLSSFHTHYKSPLYSEYYLLLYLYSCSFLRFFLLVFFSHRFHSV